MRKKFLLFLLLGFHISFAQQTLRLIAYWPMDGTANDASGRGHHGTFATTPNPIADRNNNLCAFELVTTGNSRSGDSMIVQSASDFRTNAITISVWCYLQDWYSLGPIKLFGKTEPGNKDYLFTVQNSLTFMGNSYGFPKVPFSKWSHFVASYNDGNYSMYVNGLPVKFGTTSKVVYSDSHISIGKYLSGYLDDIRVYNYQLTDSEVMDLYTAEGSCSITTQLQEESLYNNLPQHVEAIDLQGRIISQLDQHKGFAVLVYSDGTRKKIWK